MYPTLDRLYDAMGFIRAEMGGFPETETLRSPADGVRMVPVLQEMRVTGVEQCIDYPTRVMMEPKYGRGKIELEFSSFDLPEAEWGIQRTYGNRVITWCPNEAIARRRVQAAPGAFKLVRRYVGRAEEITD